MISYRIQIKGVQDALAAISRAVERHGEIFRGNVIAAGLDLEAACTIKITEVLYSIPEAEDKERKRTGNLRASRFTMWTGQTSQPATPPFVSLPNEEVPTEKHNESVSDIRGRCEGVAKGQTVVAVCYGAYYAYNVHEGIAGRFRGFKWVELALQQWTPQLIARMTTGHGGIY